MVLKVVLSSITTNAGVGVKKGKRSEATWQSLLAELLFICESTIVQKTADNGRSRHFTMSLFALKLKETPLITLPHDLVLDSNQI